MWKESLTKGRCHVAGCELTKKTCRHLDQYLEYCQNKPGNFRVPGTTAKKGPKLLYTNDIEEFGSELQISAGNVWRLFKALRKTGIGRDQIGILVRKFGCGMSFRQIEADMHWTSLGLLYKRYRDALTQLKKRGFRG